MSFNHRYVWSTAFVKELLRKECVPEAVTFGYFLAIMIFDWLQFTLIATTPTPRINVWSEASSWITFVVTVLGLLYLYRKNGGGNGKQFLQRYFPLSVTVGWKFVAAMFISLWLVSAGLAGRDEETVGWSTTVTLALLNIAMFWRIGFHLSSLSDEAAV